MKRAALILLAALVPVLAQAVDFDFTCSDNIKWGALNNTFQAKCYLTNNEATVQLFYVEKTEELPSFMWSAPLCVDGDCLAPNVMADTLSLDPSEVTEVGIYFNAFIDQGGAVVALRVEPLGVPAEAAAETLAAITNGVNVLLIDDDGAQATESYYIDALPAGTTYGRWIRSVEAPTAAVLGAIRKVIWFTGGESPTLNSTDRTILSTYFGTVNRKLFLCGQDIAYDLCDPSSPNYSTSACDFLEDVLRASYEADDAGTTDVTGDGTDPIGQDLSFSIAGGAGNQSSPDGISPAGIGNACFTYDGASLDGGVHWNDGTKRGVYLSFGLEGISSLTTRQTIMQRVFNYWSATVDVESGDPGAPARTALFENRPNPFNPATTLAFSVEREGRALVRIHDAAGRVVRTLLDRSVPAGPATVVWDGNDDSGAPAASGVYFARLTAGKASETRKITLIR
ncbi:MAG: T9SS type A sorting domain-containing protein [Candidatus Eisenbacteria bacterium]|nr:T9SS type A sorting domain-containing protein [Candidatus Eisenbacteria bacterium]